MSHRIQRVLSKGCTPERFRKWLDNHEPDVDVGEAGQECRCPMACFIRDVFGWRVRVTGSLVELRDHPRCADLTLPDWCEEFVHELDCCRSNAANDPSGDPDPQGWWRLADPDDRVTAAEARLILEEAVSLSSFGGGA